MDLNCFNKNYCTPDDTSFKRWAQISCGSLCALLVLLACLSGLLAWRYHMAHAQLQALTGQLGPQRRQQVYKQHLTEQLAALRSQCHEQDILCKQSALPAHYLELLGNCIPAHARCTQIDYHNNMLQLTGQADNHETIMQFMRTLQQQAAIEKTILTQLAQDATQTEAPVQWSIKIFLRTTSGA